MENKLLGEIKDSFKQRIAKQGMSVRKFCALHDISYETFKRLDNPTIKTLDSIETALRSMES